MLWYLLPEGSRMESVCEGSSTTLAALRMRRVRHISSKISVFLQVQQLSGLPEMCSWMFSAESEEPNTHHSSCSRECLLLHRTSDTEGLLHDRNN